MFLLLQANLLLVLLVVLLSSELAFAVAVTSTAHSSSNLLLNQGTQCDDLQINPAAPAPDAYFDPITARCAQCANNSLSSKSEYVRDISAPINLAIMREIAITKGHRCICDMSQGHANGNPIAAVRAGGADPSLVSFLPGAASMSAATCIDCTQLGKVPSIVLDEASGAQGCSSCGSVQQALWFLLNASAGTSFETADPVKFARMLTSLSSLPEALTSGDLANSTFDPASPGACVCPSTHTITETIGGVHLPFQTCVLCKGGSIDVRDPSICHQCAFPFVYDSGTRRCSGCASGYTMLPDGTCELASRLSLILSMMSGASTTTSIKPRNIDNTFRDGDATASTLLSNHLMSSGTRCYGGNNATACQLLANLCVLNGYDLTSGACKIYRAIQTMESCSGDGCETPISVPWLYYLRSSTTTFQDPSFSKHVSLDETLKFVLSKYSWNGTWLGSEPLVTQIHNCEITSEAALNFLAVGSQRQLDCKLNLPYIVATSETVFYELFIEADNGVLFPVPVLIDYSNKILVPENLGDSRVYRPAARGDLTPSENAFKRRFYLYDNIGGRVDGNNQRTSYVTYAHNVRLMVEVRPDRSSTIQVPLLILQYASSATGHLYEILDQDPLNFKRTQYLRTTQEKEESSELSQLLKYSVAVQTSSTFSKDLSGIEQALMITLIVICAVCAISSWIRTYGWMRRQQNLLLGPEAMIRWFIYLCNHISTLFAITIVVTSWILYLFYKNQANVEYMMPVTSKYLFAMLYTAVAAKGVVVLYRVMEQCNADIFVIDWERSKGQLLRENTQVPISMWRSTFIANELNEMQTLRSWHPLFVMMLVLLFLEGLDYINYARTIPYPSLSNVEYTAPTNDILRIAVAALFWVSIAGGCHILEYYIYYRFVTVNPLRAFIDLCSVSNISLMILLEPQWGFYIHGESIHAHSDISMTEFQENLKRESQGLMPARGLGGQDQCQTFEVFVGTNLRQYLYCCYAELQQEYMKALGGEAGPVVAGQHRKCFEFLTGNPGKTRTFTPQTLEIKRLINDAFIQSVRGAEKSLIMKFGLHQYFDFPPNILYMNGPFAGDEMGKDIYFLDDYHNWGNFLLYGLDLDLFIFYVLLFFAIDTSLHNAYVSMVIVYVIDLVIVFYRGREGQANLGSKTLFDERFFL